MCSISLAFVNSNSFNDFQSRRQMRSYISQFKRKIRVRLNIDSETYIIVGGVIEKQKFDLIKMD